MYNVKKYIPFLLMGLIFSLPLMCIIALFDYLGNNKNDNTISDYKSRYLIYSIMALVPAVINTTKPVEFSDIGYYYWLYEFAGTKPINEFIALIPREPLFHLYTYILRFITFGEFKLFVIITTLLMYLPVLFAFDIVLRKNEYDSKVCIYAALLLLLFPQYFLYTMQIVRQVLAGSIAFYCIVKAIYGDNKKFAYTGIVAAAFIHASAFIFCFYFIYNWMQRWSLSAKIICIGAFIIFFYAILGYVAAAGEGTTIGYAASRGLSDNAEKINVGIFPRLIALSILPMGIYILLKERKYNFTTFISITWVLGAIILTNWNTPLIVLRFMEYTYMYVPILVAMFLFLIGKEKLLPFLNMGMLVYFLNVISTSEFTYTTIPSILFNGVITYFI